MRAYHGPLAGELAAYCAFRIAQGYCEKTHAQYLVRFDRYGEEHFPGSSSLTRDMALGWLKHEAAVGLKVPREKLAALRGFANYVNATGGSAYVLPPCMCPPRRRRVPRLPTDTEMTALFSRVDSLSSGRKEIPGLFSTLYRLMYTCGLRPGEAVRLKRADVDLASGTVRIVDSKFHRDGVVAMSDDMRGLMRRHLRQTAASCPEDRYVFPGRRRSPISLAVAAKFLNVCWAEALHDLGDKTQRTVRLYDFRHRFASAVLHKWLDAGRNIFEAIPMLRVHMGHASIGSTLYYVHLLPDALRMSRGVDWDNMEKVIPEGTR